MKLQRIFTAIQMTQNDQTILRSCSKAGIMPIIENCRVTKVITMENAVLQNEMVLQEKVIDINKNLVEEKLRKLHLA